MRTLDFLDYSPTLIEKTLFQNHIAQQFFEAQIQPKLTRHPKSPIKRTTVENILLINTAAGRGGAAKIAHELLNQSFNRRGFNSKLLVNEAYITDDFIETIRHPNPALQRMLERYQRRKGLIDFFNFDSFYIKELEIFKNADIVHLNNLHGNYFSLFALPEMTALKPTIWTLHDEQSFTGHCAFSLDCDRWQIACGSCPDLRTYPMINKDTTDYLLATKKRIYENSDLTIVCYSQWLQNKLSKSILQDKDIRLIYNGIDEKIFTPTDKIRAREQLKLPLDKTILLFCANGGIHNPQKGGNYVLEAYKHFQDNPDIVFVCVGGTEQESKAANWIDVPYVEDEKTMALYYSAADLFIYPSLAETFGLVIAESMSCGTPVVAFNNSTIPELVSHQQTGYLAENKNTKDFIDGIHYFLENNALRNAASREARKVVLEKFTLDRMIDQYLALYADVLEKFNHSTLAF
jgi:protein O-GlcNAc transferase